MSQEIEMQAYYLSYGQKQPSWPHVKWKTGPAIEA